MSIKANKPTNPFKFLKAAVGQTVLVKLKDGSEYIGKLEQTDNTMNLVLSDCVKYGDDGNPIARFDKILIRGSHIAYISLNYERIAPESIKK